MTVLDLKRVLNPDLKIEYVTFEPMYCEVHIDREPEKRVIKADLEDEVLFINVLNDETVEVTIMH